MSPALCECLCQADDHKPDRRGVQGSACRHCPDCDAWRPLRRVEVIDTRRF